MSELLKIIETTLEKITVETKLQYQNEIQKLKQENEKLREENEKLKLQKKNMLEIQFYLSNIHEIAGDCLTLIDKQNEDEVKHESSSESSSESSCLDSDVELVIRKRGRPKKSN